MDAPIDNLKKLKTKYLLEKFKARKINSDPYIVKINHIISDEEIQELLHLAKNKFEKSNIMINGELIYSKTRTSSTAYLFEDGMPDKYSDKIEELIKRICYLMNCSRNQLEIMCVRYKKGEKFDKHVDYFNENEVGVIDKAGNRIATILIYLRSEERRVGKECRL